VVRRADHPSIGLVLDTFHILVRGTDLRPISAIPKDRIFLVQVADAPLLDMDYLSWSRHYRCFPGQGDLAIQPFMAALGFSVAEPPRKLHFNLGIISWEYLGKSGNVFIYLDNWRMGCPHTFSRLPISNKYLPISLEVIPPFNPPPCRCLLDKA
jgi:hypothetical protein